MIEIYHSPFTRGLRVMWACEEAHIPYDLVPVSFSPEFRFSADWLAKNPVGKVPAMQDGEHVLFESGAMVQYVLDRYGEGQLQPPRGTLEHGQMMQWSWFAEATFSRPIGEIVNHRRAFPDGEIAEVVEEMRTRANVSLKAVDAHLADREFMLGDQFSIADIMMGYTVILAERVAKLELPAHARRWWDAMQARDGYQTAIARQSAMARK